MKTSLQGIVSILADEAIVLSAYNDGIGVLTIGAGHTAMAGSPKPKKGMKISLVEAVNIFRQDLEKFEHDVDEAVDVPISQNQFDALVSWHFNTGSVRTATLTKLLNAGDVEGAAKEFARWNKANGRVLQGLSRRRKHEAAIFTNADYGNRKVAVLKFKGANPEIYATEQIARLFQMRPSDSEEELSTDQLLKNPNSRLLPRFRPQQTEQITRATIANFVHLIPEDRASDPVKILAVRGYYSNTLGEKGKNDRNLYDDAIFVLEPKGVHAFNGNTDPTGRRTGLASLSAPQAVRYIPGLHGYNRKNGPYPAFRQNSECTVLRDKKGEDTGIFWINIHRGGNNTTSSAGCQTVPPHQWYEFKTLVDNLLQEHDQGTFYYILVDQLDVASEDMIIMQNTTPEQTVQPPASSPAPRHDLNEIVAVVKTLVSLIERVRQLRSGSSILSQDVVPVASGRSQTTDIGVVLNTLTSLLDGQPSEVAPIKNESQSDQPENGNTVPGPKVEELTPINAVFGNGIGRLLNGRKTAIGMFGLLATTLLPIFFPALKPVLAGFEPLIAALGTIDPNTASQGTDNTVLQTVRSAAEALSKQQAEGQSIGSKIISAAFPVFSGMSIWGGLGKIEKWVREIKK